MLDYTEKFTLRPWDLAQSDVEGLREAGFNDEAIGMIAIIAGTYNLLNRVTDGLGCSLPRGMDQEAIRLGLISE